jgi:hypothetical protein
MEREPIRMDTAEVWQAAQRRRAADIAALFEKQRPKTGAIMPARRRLTIPTVFASLAVAAQCGSWRGHQCTTTSMQSKRIDPRPLSTDCVEKLENRGAPKISQM